MLAPWSEIPIVCKAVRRTAPFHSFAAPDDTQHQMTMTRQEDAMTQTAHTTVQNRYVGSAARAASPLASRVFLSAR